MARLKLSKLLSAPGRKASPAEYNSAVWHIKGMPWFVIGKWNRLQGNGWAVFVYDYTETFPQQDREQSESVKSQLEGQVFRTREEALQALQVALEL